MATAGGDLFAFGAGGQASGAKSTSSVNIDALSVEDGCIITTPEVEYLIRLDAKTAVKICRSTGAITRPH